MSAHHSGNKKHQTSINCIFNSTKNIVDASQSQTRKRLKVRWGSPVLTPVAHSGLRSLQGTRGCWAVVTACLSTWASDSDGDMQDTAARHETRS